MTLSRLEKLMDMAAKRPHDPFVRYGLAMEFRGSGRLREAAREFRKLLQEHPRYIAAYLHYGRTLQDLGQDSEAPGIFRAGIKACEEAGDDHARQELEEALALLG